MIHLYLPNYALFVWGFLCGHLAGMILGEILRREWKNRLEHKRRRETQARLAEFIEHRQEQDRGVKFAQALINEITDDKEKKS